MIIVITNAQNLDFHNTQGCIFFSNWNFAYSVGTGHFLRIMNDLGLATGEMFVCVGPAK